MPHSAWTGIRVFADDGYLGIVESTLPAAARPDTAAFLIVHTRMPFWKRRLLVIPLSRVVACTPVDSVARVTGSRRELASVSEADLIARGVR